MLESASRGGGVCQVPGGLPGGSAGGVCLVLGGQWVVSDPGGSAWSGGVSAPRGVCLVWGVCLQGGSAPGGSAWFGGGVCSQGCYPSMH